MNNQIAPDPEIKFPPGFLHSFEEQMAKEQKSQARKFSEYSFASTTE